MDFYNYKNIEICPVCGGENAHIDGDPISAPPTAAHNQGEEAIYFWGECGHKWVRVYSGHKGTTFKRTFEIKAEFKFIPHHEEEVK